MNDSLLYKVVPLLVRALLRAEWGDLEDPLEQTCPVCGGRKYRDEWEGPRHEDDCPVDIALKEVGLAAQTSRNAARAALDSLTQLQKETCRCPT